MDTEHSLDAKVIDLARISEPARQLVAIYDGIRRGDPPVPGRLDKVLGLLGDLPRPAGQLGADLDLLASGGDGFERDQVVAAIERLRRVSSLGARPPEAAEPTRRRTRRQGAPSPSVQLELPGISNEGNTP